MPTRIDRGVTRGPRIALRFDGQTVAAHAGDSIAAALIAAGIRAWRVDRHGRPRGLWCGMGVCYDCLVGVEAADGTVRRVRACTTPAEDGMTLHTDREASR
ncbi:2Fe-2S iron-sulfur cluster protein [Rhodothalassium salexigens DSM 2132]|uniref:2Fe-2S iron-sulfur cluster protein n=1 Tax=Rhodothalassium salexigens DSM 2132 TaxID=1188247 RepID=A0A4R2PRG8_RHOSA|nr:(2Fe-2S)-binding protein [Rhodothalassium salexigens]MBB4210309.1 sarcosine oxidase subunit alpha [Rhodothalassium salexigens DSM 2132]MBK1639218.1 hypothetical protein [Rhodothalassium salexigens DSM 2132]TCP38473.1 2Fe-2S iron-sulfur cluster protein [Rhodothalassium salexigens DSM 2132]